MVKSVFMYLLAIFTMYLIINQTILSKEEEPKVKFELADKTIPYKIANYSWGKRMKDRTTFKDTFTAIKKEVAIAAFEGDSVKIHFSKQPENVEIVEHTATKKSYVYDQYSKDYGEYTFHIGSKKGERIYEVKGTWKGNNYFTYLIKLKIL